MLVQAATLLAFAAVSSSHLIMEFPAPFAWQDSSTKQSPLELGDFPCKQSAGAYKVTTMNTWNAGETQSVKIIGGATHGGGSCQFSITTDTKPTKDSQWKVIHSMIGGCPGGPSDNNLSNDAGDTRIPGIPVTMPENIPSGQYTFAWTWVNKLGNREFYMNCAPIQVGSGSGASTASADVASALGSLPDMFTINLGPTTGCNSTEGQDFAYPNPGKSTVNTPGAHPGSDMTGPSCPSVNKMGAGKGSLGTPSQGESPSAPSQPAGSNKPAPAQPTPSSGTGGIFAPGASSAPAPPQPTAQPPTQPPAAQPTSQPPTAQPPAAQPSTAPSNGTPAQGSGDCVPCSNDGAVVCIGTTQFGLCNRGCAVPQALAAGMACVNGAIGAAAKRHIHVPRAHLRSFVH